MSQVTAIVQRIVMNADFNVSFYDRYNNLLLTLETATYAQVVNTYLICGDSDGNSIKFFVNEITSIEGPTFSQSYVPIVAGFYQQDQAYYNRLSEIYNYMETNVVNVVIRWIDALKFADGTTQTTAATGGGGSGTVTSVGFTAGTGITVGGTNPITTSGSVTITNSAPDQTVTLTEGTGIDITGTYPNFTIASTVSPGVPTTRTLTINGTAQDLSADRTWSVGDMLTSVYDTDVDGVVDSAERIQIVVRNSTGSTLTKGQIVYLSGATGNRPNAVLAQANAEATSSKTIGMVTADIPNNTDGQIAVNGTFHDLDTSAFAAGDSLWLSATTAGGYVANTPPAEPNHAVFIGYVARVHPTQGRIVLNIQNGYELDELHGVQITTPSNGQVLSYNSSSGLWVNSTPTSGTVTSIATTSPILGGPITSTGTISIQQADASKGGYLSSTDWSTFNGKQNAITLTTTGTSGAATLVGSTLNIPQYTFSGVSIYTKNSTTYSSSGSGSQVLTSLLIPANTFAAGDVIRITARFNKTGATNSSQANILVNTSASTSGATTIKSSVMAAANLGAGVQGQAVIISSTANTQYGWTQTTGNSDFTVSSGVFQTSVATNWTSNQYIIFSCNPTGDTVSLIFYMIEKL